jgi:hypothetical protein
MSCKRCEMHGNFIGLFEADLRINLLIIKFNNLELNREDEFLIEFPGG